MVHKVQTLSGIDLPDSIYLVASHCLLVCLMLQICESLAHLLFCGAKGVSVGEYATALSNSFGSEAAHCSKNCTQWQCS